MDKDDQLMIAKTSIRFFNKQRVRARWDDESLCWWYAAVDLVDALVDTKDARRYWNNFKRRHIQLSSICRQLKMTAADGKLYNVDCLDQAGINTLLTMLPTKVRNQFSDWLKGLMDPVDEQSKQKAYELYENSILDNTEVGTIKGLQQIHAFLFAGLYDFAGKIRNKNISKGGFMFANYMYFDSIFKQIEQMPSDSVEQIVAKYVELNIAHPFMEGNGRATRIWLDHLLKNKLSMCVDWQKIDKKDYLSAMEQSTTNAQVIFNLINNALTDKIKDREIFMKGIDYSYYYETIDE